MKFDDFARRLRIDKPDRFKLSDYDPGDRAGFAEGKDDGEDMLAAAIKTLADLQERLYAGGRWSVLIVLQGMDAAGKDSVVKHVMTGINPQGISVHPFKQPSAEELQHDFLWRAAKVLPGRGHIAVFNRSHYEDVLVVRVHPEFLASQNLPDGMTGKDIWAQRFEDIRAFERHLARNGTLILKFFLNVSKDEQRKRFLERIDEPAKRWKFSMGDVRERALWDKYMAAYEEMIRETSRPEAPWYVVPADHKWVTHLAVAGAMADAMGKLGLAFPKIEGAALKELEAARKALES